MTNHRLIYFLISFYIHDLFTFYILNKICPIFWDFFFCVSVDIAFSLCLEFLTFLKILMSVSKLVLRWEHLFAVAALSDATSDSWCHTVSVPPC